MFQSFETKSAPQFGRERVTALRDGFAELGIDGFLVPAPTSIRASMCLSRPSACHG